VTGPAVPVGAGSGIDPSARIGAVTLVVSDLERALAFYAGVVGLWMHRVDDGVAALGAGDQDLVVLVEDRGARPAVGTTGLFHLAVRVPSRLELARSIQRIVFARMTLTGFADHLVCESVYLDDPDGNGVEIYFDRPSAEWPLADGRIKMATDPLDLYGALASSGGRSTPPEQVDVGTVVGHVHLCVADAAVAETFYREVIGLDVMVRFPASSMLGAGGYHHHVGVNHAHTEGAPPPEPGSLGMRHFELIVGDTGPVVGRLGETGEPHPDGVVGTDPSGNRILVRSAGPDRI
jgi:catechol 2,3-dioxygenase